MALLFLLALWVSSCAVPLGPGYTVEKQAVQVHFVPGPAPRIEVAADYRLRNTGNQPLTALELRVPAPRRFRVTDLRAEWEGVPLQSERAADAPRRTRVLTFPASWAVRERRHLHLSFEIEKPEAGEPQLNLAPDAFYLPAEGWNPELLPAKGLFASGGVSPKSWELSVRVPQAFLVHASGRERKSARKNGEKTMLFTQHPTDRYPFVLAGQYTATKFDAAGETIFVWTRSAQDAAALGQVQESLTRAISVYEAAFGGRGKDEHGLWIVECPVAGSCAPRISPAMARLLAPEKGGNPAEIASLDSVLVDPSGGLSEISISAAPSLAASWLGYGRNPGFWEQEPPLSALPAFAAALGREAMEGPSVRTEVIRRALAEVPQNTAARPSGEQILSREKSLLFFYALQDRFGSAAFGNAVRHMIQARAGRGFDLDDLIAALEQETHQEVAAFVRLWLKHPGIPEDFRARYEGQAAPASNSSKETLP